MKYYNLYKRNGFTLVETLIATMLFSSIIILAIGALLSSVSVGRQGEGARTAIDTISFAMEDMTRNIRLGSNYRCLVGSDIISEEPKDCFSQHVSIEGVSGAIGNTNDQIVYSIDKPDGKNYYTLFKSVDGGSQFFPITPETVNIKPELSGFDVIGSDDNSTLQPRIIIRLSGEVVYRSRTSPFSVQTTISQRAFEVK